MVCIISSQLVCVFHASEDRQSLRFTPGAEHVACLPLGNDRRCTKSQQHSCNCFLLFPCLHLKLQRPPFEIGSATLFPLSLSVIFSHCISK